MVQFIILIVLCVPGVFTNVALHLSVLELALVPAKGRVSTVSFFLLQRMWGNYMDLCTSLARCPLPGVGVFALWSLLFPDALLTTYK